MAIGSRSSTALLSVLCVGIVAPAWAQQGAAVQLEEIVVQTTPVPGAVGIDKNKVPALISTVTPKDFETQHTPSVTDAITAHVPGALAVDVDGTNVSPDLFYRGFDTSRISGTAQGLAVYQNGVRINEAFGDSINLDLIPPIAIDHADIYTNNPIFGLNALGGAINFTMKNGFNFHGGDATLLAGSFGRVNGNIEYGKQVDNYSFYVAADGFRDGGFRPFSGSDLERAYADFGYKSQDSEIHLIGSVGRSKVGALASTPQVLVDQNYRNVFTNPQTTNNQAELGQLTGRFDLSKTWTLNSNVYVRRFDQAHVDGNDADIADCGDGTGDACLPEDAAPGTTAAQRRFLVNGKPIKYKGDDFPYGSTARTETHTTTIGTQQQLTNRDKIDGHDNYFVVGGSIDYSQTKFRSATTLGILDSLLTVHDFPGPIVLQTAGNLGYGPSAVSSTSAYYGLFTLDTFNVTKALAVTAGARYNLANVTLTDLTGINPNLNSKNTYQRINPVVGATYEFDKALTIFGGYSEANRAPTPLESGCSDPLRPCVLETALVSDPPLKQVVAHTVEAGARGIYTMPEAFGGTIDYKAAFFHTLLTDDIISQQSAISGQGYFANVGSTLRQGVEVGANYINGAFSFYGNYAYIDATYDFFGVLNSPNNPNPILVNGNEIITPGKKIPGIPAHLAKLGVEYAFTPRFIVGMDAVIVGSQFFVGDDSNLNPQLPPYYFLNAHASYQVTDNLQVFGLVRNLTNNKYATFGTYFDPGTTAGNAPGPIGGLLNGNTNANTLTVAQPLSFYGGVKITF